MTIKEIKEMAISEGFSKAEIIETEKIVFCPEFRVYCEENRCGEYGGNYSCPPLCGSPDEMRERVMRYKKALVLQSSWEIDDFSKIDLINKAKKEHNSANLRIIKKLEEKGYPRGLMAGASGCCLCSTCKIKSGEPCIFPNLRFSCLSAYCINVKKLADACSMNYLYKDGILYFFSTYFFNL